MELIYSMRRKPLKYEPPHFERASDPEVVRPICTVSSRNIIAFSSPVELNDTDGDTWAGHVYVCDLDTPWDSHKVVSTTHPVSALEWDIEGRQLLVATTEGDLSVFGQRDFLLNDWTCLYSANFPGEHIIKATFFHNGRRLVMLDKKADVTTLERIQAVRYSPTLKGFGGVALPGVCAVTASGLVVAVVEGASATSASSASNASNPYGNGAAAAHSLAAHRDRLTRAAIAHKNGKLMIAGVCVSSGGGCVVRCALAALSVGAPGGGGGPAAGGGGGAVTLSVHTQPLPTLVCPHPAGSPPTCLAWCSREDPDSLLVGGSSLAMWKLTERAHSLHKLLAKGPVQGSTTPGGGGGGGQKPPMDCFNTMVWVQCGVWATEGAASTCAACKMHIVVAQQNTVHLLNRDNMHYMTTRVVSPPEPPEPVAARAAPPKKTKYNNNGAGNGSAQGCITLSCVEISALGGIAVCIDTRAQLHVFKLPQPWADIPTALSVQLAANVLEYAAVSGYDALDVILTMKHNVLEAVYERLTDTFQRQPASFQQYYFHSWLKMRMALCRSIPSGSRSVSWLNCLVTLYGIWATVRSSVRLDDRAAEDKTIAALLDHDHPDHDKALVAFESKSEFPLELQALSALRRQLQRVLDIAMSMLATVSHNVHGYSLCADGAGVRTLRALCCAARAAGLDLAPPAARALHRLPAPAAPATAPAAAPATPPAPATRADVVEECVSASVASGSYWNRVWEGASRTNVSAPHGRPPPHLLEYGVTPDRLRVNSEPPSALQDAAPTHAMDSIRYMYLGGCGVWRGCARCGGRALPHPAPARHPAQRHHDARYLLHCRCGGMWTLFSSI